MMMMTPGHNGNGEMLFTHSLYSLSSHHSKTEPFIFLAHFSAKLVRPVGIELFRFLS